MERIGVGFSGGMSPLDIVECVKVAEGHGGDQFSVLTACAVATEKIKLGTSITSVFVRTPPTVAMAAASVDYFSNGRFILGVGSSHKVQVEPEHGLEFAKPVQRLRECVDIVRAILKDSDVIYHGEIYDIDRFDLWFQPLRREIPVYVAAVFPKMLEVCGDDQPGGHPHLVHPGPRGRGCGLRRPQRRSRPRRCGRCQPVAVRGLRQPGDRQRPDAHAHRVLRRPVPQIQEAHDRRRVPGRD